MTPEQTAAMLTVLYDARDLLLAIDRGWVRIEVGEGDSEFVQSLRKSVAHAKTLRIPPPPHEGPEPEVDPVFAAMIENPTVNPVDHEQMK
jgi:hypothetical protein